MTRILICAALVAGVWPLGVQAWDGQRGIQLVLVNNPVVRVRHTVTDEFSPPNGVMERMKGQHEAKSGWPRKRMDQGFSDAPGL